jgi:hypothetical protein
MSKQLYRAAVAWIATNDECWCMDSEHGVFSEGGIVAAALVADLFGKSPEEVCRAIDDVWMQR